jgi:prepilin-type N-terminal cleavage/methylation domain-containing protein
MPERCGSDAAGRCRRSSAWNAQSDGREADSKVVLRRTHGGSSGVTGPGGGAAREGGFTLIEVVVAIACVGVVMAALTSFVVATGRATNLAGGQQNAAELGSEGIEQVRSTAIGDLRAAVTTPNGR